MATLSFVEMVCAREPRIHMVKETFVFEAGL